jgi:hypothetical protein
MDPKLAYAVWSEDLDSDKSRALLLIFKRKKFDFCPLIADFIRDSPEDTINLTVWGSRQED